MSVESLEVAQYCAQHGYSTIIVQCGVNDTAIWRKRLHSRMLQAKSAEASHKPQTWEQLQDLLERCGMLPATAASVPYSNECHSGSMCRSLVM